MRPPPTTFAETRPGDPMGARRGAGRKARRVDPRPGIPTRGRRRRYRPRRRRTTPGCATAGPPWPSSVTAPTRPPVRRRAPCGMPHRGLARLRGAGRHARRVARQGPDHRDHPRPGRPAGVMEGQPAPALHRAHLCLRRTRRGVAAGRRLQRRGRHHHRGALRNARHRARRQPEHPRPLRTMAAPRPLPALGHLPRRVHVDVRHPPPHRRPSTPPRKAPGTWCTTCSTSSSTRWVDPGPCRDGRAVGARRRPGSRNGAVGCSASGGFHVLDGREVLVWGDVPDDRARPDRRDARRRDGVRVGIRRRPSL